MFLSVHPHLTGCGTMKEPNYQWMTLNSTMWWWCEDMCITLGTVRAGTDSGTMFTRKLYLNSSGDLSGLQWMTLNPPVSSHVKILLVQPYTTRLFYPVDLPGFQWGTLTKFTSWWYACNVAMCRFNSLVVQGCTAGMTASTPCVSS